MIMCFVDYQKAFDCVNWSSLWKILIEMRVSKHLVILIKNLYAANLMKVRINNRDSFFTINKGICQGCILSSVLFNI